MLMGTKDNIVLIGMPGAGKSTVGVVLAKGSGLPVSGFGSGYPGGDGRLLHEIISEDGVDGFLEIENDVNSRIETSRSIIATGGSVVYGEQAMRHLKEIGTVVYLELSCEEIRKRLGDLRKGRCPEGRADS